MGDEPIKDNQVDACSLDEERNLRQGATTDLIEGFNLRKDEDKHLWRKQYLQKSFYLVCFILYFSLFVVLLVGVGLLDLTQTIVVTLLGSTVAEVIGILLVAFNWLYPKATTHSEKEKGKEGNE